MLRPLALLALPGLAYSQACTTDSDCHSVLRQGTHSFFCQEGECTQLTPSGHRCSSATECTSYFFYGPLACTAKCGPDAECMFSKEAAKDAVFCCKAAPAGAECLPERPALLSGCPPRHKCSQEENGPVCVPNRRKRWAFGPVLSITGNLLINVGLNLQKRSYLVKKIALGSLDLELFYVGIAAYAAGKIFGFSSYIFGDQSMLASLGCIGLIANSVFAPMINNEVFTLNDFFAIGFVLTGSTLIVINSGRIHRVFSLCELLRMYARAPAIAWFASVASLAACLFFAALFVESNSDWALDGRVTRLFKLQRVHFGKNDRMLKHFMVFVYVGLSAAIASFTTLFAKSFGEMVDLTLSGDNQFVYFSTYMFFLLIFACTCGQIFWLNRALQRYDALLVIPIFHILWTLLSVTTAGIYFQDFALFGYQQFRGFILGLCTIFVGSTFLGFRLFRKDAPFTEKVQLDIKTKAR